MSQVQEEGTRLDDYQTILRSVAIVWELFMFVAIVYFVVMYSKKDDDE